MSIDPVVRELSTALKASPVATSPGISKLLARAVARSTELCGKTGPDSPRFFRQVGKEIVRIRGTAYAQMRLSCLFMACENLFLNGEASDALSFGRHGAELARSAKDLSNLRRFHALNGILAAETGDRGLALQSYAESLRLAIELKDGFGVYAGWNNLSALLVDSGLYEESIACARRALHSIRDYQLTQDDLPERAHTNIALALYRLGDFEGALSSAIRSLAGIREPETPSEADSRIVREEHLTLSLIALGRHEEAQQHVHYMSTLAKRFPSPRLALLTATSQGLFEVVRGNVPSGLQILKSAVSIADSRKCPAYADALAALALAYDVAGECDEALQATRKLVRYLESTHLESFLLNISVIDVSWNARRTSRGTNQAELRRSEAELLVKVLQRELLRSRLEMLERMAVAADIREDISGEHGYRVGLLSALLAKESGWDRDSCNAIDVAARLHDIGKFGVPENILKGKMTLGDAEKLLVVSHTRIGAEILSKSDIPQVRIAEEIALCHHEWWDGNGYPRQLKAMAIPKSARIVALADAFDAMTHGRPYADPIPIETALDQIASLRGRQFDPELTDHFLALVRRLAAENKDLDAYLGKAARNSPFLKARARIKEMLAQGRDSKALPGLDPSSGAALN